MTAAFPAFPLWTDALISDTKHLSSCEFGAYMRLLLEMWRAPDQRLPNDDKWLSRRFGMTAEDVENVLRPIIKELCQSTGNWITDERVTREFAFVASKSKKQSVRAKSRWDKEKGVSHGNAPTLTLKETSSKDDGKKAEAIEARALDLVQTGDACLEAMGGDKSRFTGGYHFLAKPLAEYGSSTLISVAKRLADRPGWKQTNNPFSYFMKALPDVAREIRAEDGNIPPMNHLEETQKAYLICYQQTKRWYDDWGTNPNDERCKIPLSLLVQFGLRTPEGKMIRVN